MWRLLHTLPRFELLSKLDNISSLNHHDLENNFMQQTDFKYYTLEDFLVNEDTTRDRSEQTYTSGVAPFKAVSPGLQTFLGYTCKATIFVRDKMGE